MASHPAPHPWLKGAQWFVEASERLISALHPASMLIIGLDSQKNREPTHGVRVQGPHDQEELDDMPGLRKIERRAGELAHLLPAAPPFGARIAVNTQGIAVQLRWHLQGRAMLLSRRMSDGWASVDVLVMPARVFGNATDDDLLREKSLLVVLDRLLGSGRLDPRTKIRSAKRRGDEIRIEIDPGGILHMGSNEVA